MDFASDSLPSFCFLGHKTLQIPWCIGLCFLKIILELTLGCLRSRSAETKGIPSPCWGATPKLSFPWHWWSLTLVGVQQISMGSTILKWRTADFPRQVYKQLTSKMLTSWHYAACISPHQHESFLTLTYKKRQKNRRAISLHYPYTHLSLCDGGEMETPRLLFLLILVLYAGIPWRYCGFCSRPP